MSNYIIIAFFILTFFNLCFAQDIKKQESSIYKNAKIHLKSGELLQCKNLMVIDSTLIVTLSKSNSRQEILLKDVNYIQVAKGKHTILGGFLGGAVALGAALIINETGDVTTHSTSTTTYTYDEYGRHSSTSPTKTEIERTLSNGNILTMVAAGALIGGIIGHTKISGWKELDVNGVDSSGEISIDHINDKAIYRIKLKNGNVVNGMIIGVSENWIFTLKRNKELLKLKITSVREIYDKHFYKRTEEILNRADLKITDDCYRNAIEY